MIFHVSNYRGGGDDFVTFGRFLWWKCIKKTWFWTKRINISMHFGTKRIKGLCFSTFLCVNFDFFLEFSSRKCTMTCLTICRARDDFFRKILMFFAWKYVVFMRKSSVFKWFFRSKRIKALCFFIIFARFFDWEKNWEKNRFRECRWSFLTRFLLSKYMILERKRVVFQQLF